jgi:hypothetical protein
MNQATSRYLNIANLLRLSLTGTWQNNMRVVLVECIHFNDRANLITIDTHFNRTLGRIAQSLVTLRSTRNSHQYTNQSCRFSQRPSRLPESSGIPGRYPIQPVIYRHIITPHPGCGALITPLQPHVRRICALFLRSSHGPASLRGDWILQCFWFRLTLQRTILSY